MKMNQTTDSPDVSVCARPKKKPKNIRGVYGGIVWEYTEDAPHSGTLTISPAGELTEEGYTSGYMMKDGEQDEYFPGTPRFVKILPFLDSNAVHETEK